MRTRAIWLAQMARWTSPNSVGSTWSRMSMRVVCRAFHVGEPAEVIVPAVTTRYTAKVQRIGWLMKYAVGAHTDAVAAVNARTVEGRLTLDQNVSWDSRHRIDMQAQVVPQP
jgi:hypothetical protein